MRKRESQDIPSCFCRPCTPRTIGDRLPVPDFLHTGSSLAYTAVSNSSARVCE